MITTTKLASIGVVSLGVIGCTTGAIYSFQNKSITIEKKLLSENKKILREANETLWKIKLATYKQVKIANTQISLEIENTENLKIWCSKNISIKFDSKNEALYEGIRAICTVPTQKERLFNENKVFLNKEDWKTKAQSYHSTNEGAIPNISKGDNAAVDLENWCNSEFKKEYLDASTNNDTLVVKWCTK